ncbi:hypothetical protein [Kocuria dechangensis]|uniref:hypothetical protein n=1 Tax=Kocuria dechangensis TaxID=1176249 RepID=UPI00166E8D98|nr:hypothetical protein [Kocuria dechangensis]
MDSAPGSFRDAVAGYATTHGLVATVETVRDRGEGPAAAVALSADPDTVFDLTMAAVRQGDVPADFQDRHAPTGAGSAHLTWATASAAAFNRHRLGRRLPRYQHDITALAAAHRISAVTVRVLPLRPATVLQQLLGIKHV